MNKEQEKQIREKYREAKELVDNVEENGGIDETIIKFKKIMPIWDKLKSQINTIYRKMEEN